MALPCNDGSALSYVVFREIPVGCESYDPTVPPTFWPPKDSDELFDALRAKFPHRNTHSERMRDAMIEFLHEEQLQAGQYHVPASSSSSSSSSGAIRIDPNMRSYPSNGSHSHSGSSVLSSPEMLNFATPASFDSSPMAQMPQHCSTRQASVCNSSGQPSPPPSLDQMTGVFSLSSGPQPRQRVRRKMTEAEKVEYRKRRIVKACDKCARRKRKCQHNQPDMDSVRPPHHSSNFGHKVAKSCASASSAKSSSTIFPPTSQQQTESFLGHPFIDFSPLDFPLDLMDFPLDDDMSMFPDLHHPSIDVDVDVNDFLHPDIFQSDDHHPVPTVSRAGVASGKMPASQPSADVTPFDGFEAADWAEPNWADLDEMGWIPRNGGVANANDDSYVHIRRSSSFVPDRTAYSTSTSSSSPDAGELSRLRDQNDRIVGYGASSNPSAGDLSRVRNRYDRIVGYGNSLHWERLHTEQDEKPVPTHTAHYHNALCPNTDSDSSGYSSSTSSDQDAMYEAIPLDWRNHSQNSRVVSGYSSVSEKDGGAPRDRDLLSTSMTVSDGVSNSAAPLGRPQSAATTAADTVSRQASGNPLGNPLSPGSRRPLSFGTGSTGLLDNVNPRTELFMLRHRVLNVKPSIVVRQASVNAQLSVILQDANNAPLTVIPRALTNRRPPSLLPEASGVLNGASSSIASSSTLIPAGPRSPYQERLSDHVLHRDHHGRIDVPVHGEHVHDRVKSSAVLYIAAAGVVCAVFALGQTTDAAPWLLLALLALATNHAAHRHPARWGNEVQCTKDNSRWLISTFVSRRAMQNFRRSAREPAFAWLRGLMYPFQLAPLRSVC